MGNARKRRSPRRAELLAILALVWECRELWYDPDAWRGHLLTGLHRLIGGAVVGVEQFQLSGSTPVGASQATATATVGWPDDRTRDAFQATLAEDAVGRGLPACVYEYIAREMSRFGKVEVLPCAVAGERAWHRSPFYVQCFDPFGLENVHASFRALPQIGQLEVLNVNQAQGQPTIQPWQLELLALLHDAVAPLVGTCLAVEGQVSADGLSPRRREVLALLLEGLSEKEVATRLGISPATAHQYVGEIYRQFRVCSRAELMAYFIRRWPRPG